MELDLNRETIAAPVLPSELSVAKMSWWFWVKAGIGFSLGAGFVYALFGLLWLFAISRVPSLIFVRALAR